MFMLLFIVCAPDFAPPEGDPENDSLVLPVFGALDYG
jgi:hypothetical protein